jgi:hypothetical protein
LGSRRHLCCGGRRYTDADANSHGDSDRHCDSNRHADSHGDSDSHSHSDRHADGQPHCNNIGNSHATTDANAQVGAIRKTAPHASAEAIEFRRTGNSW